MGELKLLPTPLISDNQRREYSECIFFVFLWEHRRSLSVSLIFTDVVRNNGFIDYLENIMFLAGKLV